MSLLQGYSSGEDDAPGSSTDVFGLSSLHAAKKPRIDEAAPSGPVLDVIVRPQAAPDVLAEVRK